MKEPYDKFEKDYKGSIHNLSAKEGLGKTFWTAKENWRKKDLEGR